MNLHFRLVDERGVVHVDQVMEHAEDAFDQGLATATAHVDIAHALDVDGIGWCLEITASDGEVMRIHSPLPGRFSLD